MPEETMEDNGKQPQSSDRGMAKQQSGTPDIPDAGNSYDRMKRLSADEEFSALLYAVQQYLGKTFSAIECEKFAYFYDVLHMSCELLEYLAEYCAEGGHTSIRYIEKVALNWYQAGIHTRDEAQPQMLYPCCPERPHSPSKTADFPSRSRQTAARSLNFRRFK